MKISILLPYKENFSPVYPGAVSIFIKDTSTISKYKKNITVYGSTNYKKKLSKNYVNLPFNKELLQSQTKIYVDNFLKQELQNPSDLIEIHNRPIYINHLYKQTKANFVLFYHNDPLNMSGSKLVKERNGRDLIPDFGYKPVNKYLPRQKKVVQEKMLTPTAKNKESKILQWLDSLLS